MSRWTDLFKNHPFQAAWESIKTNLENETVDDVTVITSVNELARLKKVTAYLDGALLTLDPELVPPSTWDNFQSQSNACLQQIINYRSNRNIQHIVNANGHADNLLTYIRPYMIAPKSVGTVLSKALKSYANNMDQYLEEFQKKSNNLLLEIGGYRDECSELNKEILNTSSKVQEFESELLGNEENEGIKDKITILATQIESMHTQISETYDEILVGDEKNISASKAVTKAKEDVLAKQIEVEKLLQSVTDEVSDLNDFYIKVFGVQSHDDDEVIEGGLKNELNEKLKALSDFESKQSIKYKALIDQIEGLLPGATTAGLASAYLEMKNSFNNPIRNSSIVFFIAIAILVIAAGFLAIDATGIDAEGAIYINFVEFNEWDVVLKGLIYKIPFYGPIIWLAYYASKRRSEYQRLQQEYAHKEALAKSYDSYKKQLLEIDDKDQTMLQAFLTKAIDAIAFNASATLDGKHGDKMPSHDAIEKSLDYFSKLKEIATFKN